MSFEKIFKKGSQTYYNSSKFFSEEERKDIEILYAFVRTADDYVDKIPQDKKSFIIFKNTYYSMIKKKSSISIIKSSNPNTNYDFGRQFDNQKNSRKRNGAIRDVMIISAFIDLSVRKNFDPKWTDSFLSAMESDMRKKSYHNLKELEIYIHGSAEVIGLFMCSILQIPRKAAKYAMLLGKAMQYINFIRDISEDKKLGRTYLPISETMKITGRKSIADLDTASFEKLIRFHIDRYMRWQLEAEKGFKYIKKKNLIPIKTASDMYKWTAKKIYTNPSIVLKKKMKPSKLRIIVAGLRNGL